jgi:hypothetical protein
VYNDGGRGPSAPEASPPSVQAPTPITAPSRQTFGGPQLFFFCELNGAALQHLLDAHGLLPILSSHGYGVALAIRELDESTAATARLLNRHNVPVVAWLLLASADGEWFHLQNYPQAVERYQAFAHWASERQLAFQAVGLDIEPPSSALNRMQRRGGHHLLRRVWQAQEHTLYTAARAAYTELVSKMHHDGYEVHTYQLPILADDRRAGTTLAQRTLDIVDLPADVEVLLCYSSAAIEAFDNDLGGALIESYGPDSDAIAVGAVTPRDGRELKTPALTWQSLRRDLLLAARHTDIMYIYSLEGCVEQNMLLPIGEINWDATPPVSLWKYSLISIGRRSLQTLLLLTRFGRSFFAWLGWGLFALLLARRLRSALGR